MWAYLFRQLICSFNKIKCRIVHGVFFGQAFHSQGTLGAKSYITQNSNWKIISYKSNEKNIYLIFWSVTQLHSYLVWEISRVTQLHNYIIHWLGKIIGKNICLIFWSVTQLHSKQCRKNQMKWKKKRYLSYNLKCYTVTQ